MLENIESFLEKASDIKAIENLGQKIISIAKNKKDIEDEKNSGDKTVHTNKKMVVETKTNNVEKEVEDTSLNEGDLKNVDSGWKKESITETAQNIENEKKDIQETEDTQAKNEEEIKENDQENFINSMESVKWQKKSNPGRPSKTKKINALGQEVVKEKKKFCEKTTAQKKSWMLKLILKENLQKLENSFTKEYKIKLTDITEQKIQHFITIQPEDLKLLSGHFEDSKTEEKFLKNIQVHLDEALYLCGHCQNKLKDGPNSLQCQSCLTWYHMQICISIKKKPRKAWFCTKCCDIFKQNPTNYF